MVPAARVADDGRRARTESSEKEAGGTTPTLIERAKGGDRGALAALVERFRPLLLSAAKQNRPFAPLPTVDDDDLRQQAALSLIELTLEYKAELGPVGSYLKNKLGWRLANYVRAERRRSGFGKPVAQKTMAPRALEKKTPKVGLLGRRRPGLRGVSLQSALRQLTPRQRAIIYKHHWEDKTSVDVARELGITHQSASAMRRRAEEVLREELLGRMDQTVNPSGAPTT
jgi:DNA-directed RNA polymerase specialized sigma24 family protein